MNLPIPESSVFYVTLRDPNGKEIIDGVFPIATYLAFTEEHENGEESRWGFVKWYDKIASDIRTLSIQAEPKIVGKNYTITDVKNFTLEFKYIDKKIYNEMVKTYSDLSLPNLDIDEDVQKYLMDWKP